MTLNNTKMKEHGGKRKNAGRKKLPNELKKRQVAIFVTNKRYDALGRKKIKSVAEAAVNKVN